MPDNPFLDYIRNAQAARSRLDGCQPGYFRCEYCGRELLWDGPGDGCSERARVDEERNRRADGLRLAYESLPQSLSWCSVAEPLFASRCKSRDLVAVASSWERAHGNLLVLGPTGWGKTIAVVALLRRILDAAKESDLGMSAYSWAARSRFLTAVELVANQKRSGRNMDGTECELLRMAKQASILVLDEVGFEDECGAWMLELVNHRENKGFKTIMTSGCTDAQFRNRYGDAVHRRMTERGVCLDLWRKV